jgi:ferredoxin, 2Fe-2S
VPNITYVRADGTASKLEVASGMTLMDGLIRHNEPGVVAECGGACSCGTCHVYVAEEWLERVGEASEEEMELLEFDERRRDTSRLSCQILIGPELDGMVLSEATDA